MTSGYEPKGSPPLETKGPARPLYRPDIDGLRGLAVILVLLYHVRLLHVTGGYIGVDLFFVISGYLISGQINSQLKAGSFSFKKFFVRRVLRIMPALYAMVFVTTFLGMKFLVPGEAKDLAQSALSTLLSVSNFYFWSLAGYFDGSAESKPLLHTWSLGVEEQFYFIFPVLMFAIYRLFPKRLTGHLAALAIGTLALSLWLTSKDSTAAFYFPVSRFWEFLIGSLIAVRTLPKVAQRGGANFLSITGLAVILYSSLTFDDSTNFPGWAALSPCLGAALLIASSERNLSVAGKLLSLGPIRFIGKISYSIYLWHWTLIVFQKTNGIFGLSADPRIQKWFVVLVSIGLGYLSWKFIERPFRHDTGWLSTRVQKQLLLGSFVSLLAINALIYHKDGFPSRFPASTLTYAKYFNNYDKNEFNRINRCFIEVDTSAEIFDRDTCLKSFPGRKRILLIGDSHLAYLWLGLSQAMGDLDVMQATAAACLPTLQSRPKAPDRCTGLMSFIFNSYLQKNRPDLIVLGANWSTSDLPSLRGTLKWLKTQNLKVSVFGLLPILDAPLPRLLVLSAGSNDPKSIESHRPPYAAELDHAMKKLAVEEGASYLSLQDTLCDQSGCRYELEDHVPLFFDYGHFTREGSIYAGALISKDLRNFMAQPRETSPESWNRPSEKRD